MTNTRTASLLADALNAVSLDTVWDEPPSDAPTTDSESDWSDAELREADCQGNGAPPSAAQGMGRPWAHVARARRTRRAARAERNSMRFQGDENLYVDDSPGAGVFLSDLDASAAINILACLDPVDRARVAATRHAERTAMSHSGYVSRSARSTPRSSVSCTPVGSFKSSGFANFSPSPRVSANFGQRGVSSASPRVSFNVESPNAGYGSPGVLNPDYLPIHERAGEGHLADAAWRDVDLKGEGSPVALASLRKIACGSLVNLDATGSRGVKRGELLDLVRESPKLKTLKVAHLGDTGKFSCKDCELFLAACPSLRVFECDVGVSASKVKDKDGNYVPSSAEFDLAALLAPGGATVARRLKIHSADAEMTRSLAALAAGAASEKKQRVYSLDISWGLKLSCGAAEGVAVACETRGRGFPFTRLAMRKANVKCPGATQLALAIKRAAQRVETWEKQKEYQHKKKAKGEDGHGDLTDEFEQEMFAVDVSEDNGHEYEVPPHNTHQRDNRRPTCRLRWLDLGSNLIGDRGGAALGDALTFRVPITRLSLRDNPLGVEACASLGVAVARCKTLRRLDLAHCGFGDPGVVAFCAGLMSTSNTSSESIGLRVLQLGFNNIGEVGIKALVEVYRAGLLQRLEHLDLACNVLGPKGTEALAGLLQPVPGFETFDEDDVSARRHYDDTSDEEDGDFVSKYDTDEKESMHPRRGGLYSLDIAVNNCSITLNGDGEKTGERFGVKALLKALESNKTLRQLNLRGNDLTPEIAGDVAEMLLENETLTMVNVGYNKIYNEGTWELAEALSENSNLKGLDLQRNEISDEGAVHVRSLLSENVSIAEVDMRSNMLSPETVAAFGTSFGQRVNCRWQQEPPKVDKQTGVQQCRTVADGFGGGVAARRAAKKAAKAAK